MAIKTQQYERTAEGKLKCPDCEEVFDRPQDMGRHRAIKHGYVSPKRKKRKKRKKAAATKNRNQTVPSARKAPAIKTAGIVKTWAPELATRQSFGQDGTVLITFAGGDIFLGRPAEVRQKAPAIYK